MWHYPGLSNDDSGSGNTLWEAVLGLRLLESLWPSHILLSVPFPVDELGWLEWDGIGYFMQNIWSIIVQFSGPFFSPRLARLWLHRFSWWRHLAPFKMLPFQLERWLNGWVLTALPEDPGLVPSIHVEWLITACNFKSRGPDTLFWPQHPPTQMWWTHTHTLQKNKTRGNIFNIPVRT